MTKIFSKQVNTLGKQTCLVNKQIKILGKQTCLANKQVNKKVFGKQKKN